MILVNKHTQNVEAIYGMGFMEVCSLCIESSLDY